MTHMCIKEMIGQEKRIANPEDPARPKVKGISEGAKGTGEDCSVPTCSANEGR